MGKASFLGIRDREGDLQLFVKKDKVGEQAYELLKLTDLGDIVFARGRAMRTRTGELSIEAAEFKLLTKALRPLPEKWHGLTDHETRYRQRYVDLAVNLEERAAYQELMVLPEQMVSRLATEVTGSAAAPFQGATIDYTPPWQRISMIGEVAKLYGAAGLDDLEKVSDEQWLAKADDREARNKL